MCTVDGCNAAFRPVAQRQVRRVGLREMNACYTRQFLKAHDSFFVAVLGLRV